MTFKIEELINTHSHTHWNQLKLLKKYQSHYYNYKIVMGTSEFQLIYFWIFNGIRETMKISWLNIDSWKIAGTLQLYSLHWKKHIFKWTDPFYFIKFFETKKITSNSRTTYVVMNLSKHCFSKFFSVMKITNPEKEQLL